MYKQMEKQIAKMTDEEVRAKLLEIAKYADAGCAYLSTSNDYAKGYKDGIVRGKEIIIETIIDC